LGINSTSEVDGLIQAVLQHYGYETFFLDLTSRLDVAAWFASHDYSSQRHLFIGNQFRRTDMVKYEKASTGNGYVLVMAIKDAESLKSKNRLIDLSCLPEFFERPFRQAGWLMLDRPPTRPLPDDFLVSVIKVELDQFNAGQSIQPFPPASEDAGFAKMRELPFVQFDTYDSKKTTPDNPTGHQAACAVRLLNLPEYHYEDQTWNDVTIYEPLPVREWQVWHAKLGDLYAGAEGDIAETKKITISPAAKQLLQITSNVELAWPNLGSDALFFSFAELDHDKVIEHSPPYHGVWLQRSGSLIIETPTMSDEKVLSVGKGHAFFLKGQELAQQEMPGSCDCGSPESHEFRVRGLLRIQSLVTRGDLILLPHPYHGNDWFIVFSADERKVLADEIGKFQRIHRMIMDNLSKHDISAKEQ
jgi:hypothetical protein